MDPVEIDITELFAQMVRRAAHRPRSASAWLNEKNADLTVFQRAIDNALECGCGGKDGVIVTVPKSDKPTVRGMVMVSSFSHHQGDRTTTAFLTADEAKHLVNALGEAIAVAESEIAAAAAGGNG